MLVILAAVAVWTQWPATRAHAEAQFTVRQSDITDQKAVFATVESPNVVPARSRIGGTVANLAVKQGDPVTEGQVIAVVGDEKLLLQISSLDAQIAGLQSQLAQAQIDFTRAETLARQGAGSRAALDQARTALEVGTAALHARSAERAVAQQNLDEGKVLAPVAGRVLTVPLTIGTVVMNGDTIATIGEQPFKLRLRIPERHALSLNVGDPIRISARQPGAGKDASGTITLIYPQIQDGRVVADATVTDIGSYFVGDRVLVWINAGTRPGFVIPSDFVHTRFGLDYVTVHRSDGTLVEVPVQRGEERTEPDIPNGLEILSGIQPGDVLVRP
ncbi:efflux RND transporter periplasmic adaptor subunit [Rhodopila sp.]|uniref:efflux RND transporter periplasmic adaptor subunit n=1 Tax=Rhodopila sp. TaxID=2480087 RepID=UPI002CFABBB3|nr:efflux RND transporter periplasmic adaptor subunit [Rhodopila sp.]HVZ10538.1 efflux RND transporter periplasmic adaptor subunit [Rhodopila sp.]